MEPVASSPEDLAIIRGLLVPGEQAEAVFDLGDPKKSHIKVLFTVTDKRLIMYEDIKKFRLTICSFKLQAVSGLTIREEERTTTLEISFNEQQTLNIGGYFGSDDVDYRQHKFHSTEQAQQAHDLILSRLL